MAYWEAAQAGDAAAMARIMDTIPRLAQELNK